jgi:cell division protein FtsW
MRRESIVLINVVAALCLIGVLMVYSAGTARAFGASSSATAPTFSYLTDQLLRLGIGLVGFFIAARFDYHSFARRGVFWPLMAAMVGALVLVLLIGVEKNGAQRWLSIGGQTVQPSDFAKAGLVIALAATLSHNRDRIREFWRGFLPPMLWAGLITGLIVLQKDIGTPVVLGAVALLLVTMAGARLWHVALSIAPAFAAFAAYVAVNPHAQERLYSFREPWQYREDEGWQLIQSLWAFSRGGLFGQGTGAGQGKLHYLPEAHSDFIFAVWGEEMGLIGTLTVVVLFAVFLVIGLRIAVSAPDLLGGLIAAGVTCVISLQAVLSMGVTTGALPTKGLTLPFISAGGTALIVYLTMVGILINVALQCDVEEPVNLAAAAQRA